MVSRGAANLQESRSLAIFMTRGSCSHWRRHIRTRPNFTLNIPQPSEVKNYATSLAAPLPTSALSWPICSASPLRSARRYNARLMNRLDNWRFFLALAIFLIAVGVLRSAWATRRDGFTIDEPWHITAGVAYLRPGEYCLNPAHPPLVKLVAGLAAPRRFFYFSEPGPLHDKLEERKF